MTLSWGHLPWVGDRDLSGREILSIVSLWLGVYPFYSPLTLWQGQWNHTAYLVSSLFKSSLVFPRILCSQDAVMIQWLFVTKVMLSGLPLMLFWSTPSPLMPVTEGYDLVTTIFPDASGWRLWPHHHLLLLGKVSKELFAFSQLIFPENLS